MNQMKSWPTVRVCLRSNKYSLISCSTKTFSVVAFFNITKIFDAPSFMVAPFLVGTSINNKVQFPKFSLNAVLFPIFVK